MKGEMASCMDVNSSIEMRALKETVENTLASMHRYESGKFPFIINISLDSLTHMMDQRRGNNQCLQIKQGQINS